jgi:hypothetical protein
MRSWITEAKQASRERRRRAQPIRLAVVGLLVATWTILGISDAIGGIRLPVYFWVTGAIVLAGLLVGLVLRRTPWSVAPLLLPVVAGMIAFGNSGASLHDGIGQNEWTPLSASDVTGSYRLAFGQGVLDLRNVGPLDRDRTVDVTMAAGQVQVLLPSSLNAVVDANVRIGQIDVDGTVVAETDGGGIHRVSGYDINKVVLPSAQASGPRLMVHVHLADGEVSVRHS